jgi:ketosteroid isomerase-like protein
MTKKDIKTFFKAVSSGDLDTVAELVQSNAEVELSRRQAQKFKDAMSL